MTTTYNDMTTIYNDMTTKMKDIMVKKINEQIVLQDGYKKFELV